MQYQKPENLSFRHECRIATDKLVLDDKVYTVDQLHKLPEYLQPHNVATPSNKSAVVFFTAASPLSNHYLADMKVGSHTFNCMEQYLMYTKAIKFSDTDSAQKILSETNPGKHKELGKKTAGFDSKVWMESLDPILIQGLTSKFNQNDFCKTFLKNTGEKKIGEACKDEVYGIGMDLRNENVLNTTLWCKEGNAMGKCLETVRAAL